MPGLVPGIHVLCLSNKKDVDGRDKPGHDEKVSLVSPCSGADGPIIPVQENAMNYLLVFIGGGLGASLRHAVNVLCARCLGTAFPWGTFIINISGSTVMGLIAGYLAFKGEASQAWRLFLMTGILGGYTTFSAFSLDAVLLYERGEIALALFYVLGSVVFSILGLFAGLALVRHLA
jgi:fluoride exporter